MAARRIYLDHNATAPPAPGVVEAMATAFGSSWGNPSSAHAEGRRARALVDNARAQVAAAVGAEPDEVVFTSGGSEADALALRGLVDAGLVRTLVVWDLEHPAVLDNATWMAEHAGVEVRRIPANRRGQCEVERVAEIVRGADRPLVSVMLAQNEIGTINNVPAIVRAAREGGALVHTDAVQALGKVPFSFRKLGVDLMSVSSHKIGGPPGAGALVIRGEFFPVPYCMGGGQEKGRRQGTEGQPALVGFGAAAAQVRPRQSAEANLAALRDRLERTLMERLPHTLVLGVHVPRLPNTSALVFKGVRGAEIAADCDARGLSVSAGSACHAGAHAPSPVATAVGLPGSHRAGLVRVSLGPETMAPDIDAAIEILADVVARRQAS